VSRVLILNGPNINLLGSREKDLYGTMSYEELCEKLKTAADGLGMELTIYQSNHEGELVDRIQSAPKEFDVIIINPGGYTHTSVAIRDALLAVAMPCIELHISNVYKREEFRKHSYISDIADGIIAGFGTEGYFLALKGVQSVISARSR
jgi:3-dehydroquinate dehydratase-2